MSLNGKTTETPWLSPKRDRTTSNLKTVANGQSETAKNGLINRPITPGSSPELPRPMSQSDASNSTAPEFPGGNLFYAYARRSNDLKTRYLLTFASASVANEWWQLLQTTFRGTSRPGIQLFSVSGPETLAKAWQHPKFEHLKSKWMYISFSDTTSNGMGGAVQGIIPVQDAQGNVLGNGASTDLEAVGQLRNDSLEAKNGVTRLEEYFERMMEAFERSMTQASASAATQRCDSMDDKRNSPSDGGYNGTTTTPDLSEHMIRLTDMMTKNAEHVAALASRQSDQDQKLHTALQDVAIRQKSDDLNMGKLSSHLDRIHGLMEQSVRERKDSANSIMAQPPRIDFSPLTDRLEKMQEAVEQNSALIKALLDEGAESSKPSTPFWGKEMMKTDFSPLTGHLEKIHDAIEQQSSHMQALVGFASGDENGVGHSNVVSSAISPITEKNLAPLGEHLEHIFEAITEGNRYAKESIAQDQLALGLTPISTKFDVLVEKLESSHDVPEERTALGEKLDEINEHLQCLREWTEFDSNQLAQLLKTQNAAHEHATNTPEWTSHLSPMRKALEQTSSNMKYLLEKRPAAVTGGANPSDLDLTPVTERLTRIHESLERQTSTDINKSPGGGGGTGDARFLLSALTSHISQIQAVTDQNAHQTRLLRERLTTSHDNLTTSLKDSTAQIQSLAALSSSSRESFSPQQQKQQQQRFEQRLEATSSQVRELMSGHREMLEVMREIARSLAAAGVRGCEHIVVPPPRKMGRKVVGFVYDAKDEVG